MFREETHHFRVVLIFTVVSLASLSSLARAQSLQSVDAEGQPVAANVGRVLQALEVLGSPLPADTTAALKTAIDNRDAKKIQELLDAYVLIQVTLNPESRVKVARGPATATLQQGGFVPFIIKVINDSTVKKALQITSPQEGTFFAGGGAKSKEASRDRFLQAEMYTSPPMTANLSGLKLEYAIALIYSHEAGSREATIGFDVGQGTQDLGFRGEVPILFDVRPGINVRLFVKDFDGKPTVGRFTFKDRTGRVYPLQAKRLAPDFFF